MLQIRLLGPLEVVVAGRLVVVDTRKALAIVALVAAEGRPFAREELAAMFWPDADDEAARGALRRTLSALRKAVGEAGLRIERTRVALDPGVEVDLATLERLSGSTNQRDLEAAAALARGPFLAGFALRDSPDFDDWQASRATRAERTVGELLDRLAVARLQAGDPIGAGDAARRRVDLDPLDEGGQRRLIELLARSGDRAGAIGQYRTLVALFDRELGVPPLRETTDLYDAIREGTLPDVVVSSGRVPQNPGRGQAVHEVPPSLPMAGRDPELRVLLEAWHRATSDGRVGLVEGEAGIGKTRLAETIADRIRAAGGTALASRGYPGEAAIPYGPIAGLLRMGLALPGGAARLGALDEIARMEIGRLVDLPASIRVTGPPLADDASARVRLLDAIAQGLTALVAGPVPGLVWMDDLHLADDPSREAAAYLARRLAGRPLLLLLAWRREDFTPDGQVSADGLRRTPDATVVHLGRLDRASIALIVAAARPAETAADADAFVDALTADSEGLPLHVVEVLTSSDAPGGMVPRGVQAMLRDRVASVGETAAQVLSAAAVIGRSFDLATVRQAGGRTEEETVDALEELLRRGLVREVPGTAADQVRYDFSHARTRDAAYEATSLARRRLLHRRTAEALRLDLGDAGRDDVTRFALIGFHEREAGRPTEAAAAYREAADRAEAVYANREAIDHLGSALALGTPDAAGAHARIGELRARLGEYPAAVASLETAAALAQPDELAAIEVSLGRVQRRRGDLAAADSHLVSALAVPGLPDTLRTRGLVERTLIALRAGDLSLADASAREARVVAERTDDRHLAGVAERLVGLVAQALGDPLRARAALERSLALAEEDPDPTASIAARTALALTQAAAGDVDEAVASAVTAIETCRRIGDRHLEAAVENHVADLLHDAGREADSMEHLKRAVALFAEIGEGEPEPDPGIWRLAAW